ncbi:hypothetical protein LMTR13_09815 [Bradyrhizobium icense]|uniref:Uncharacterized protein n=1 Tax=Bradyrhizobium icense TaxID=1274631 RepID=A0A1B1UCC4_9BRAD|nr:hypothetical protein LMTR13_09815 [Bradyrhizobium icense]
MAQLMFARRIQELCRSEVVVFGHKLPEWSLQADLRGTAQRSNLSVGSNLTRADYLAAMINRCRPPTIELDGVVLRVGNYGDIERYREMFPLKKEEGIQIGKDRILIHIRAGDVSVPSHGSYGPVPISYYQYLVSETKLTPVFIGETSQSPYMEALSREFPGAEFVGGASAFEDFQTIRRAQHIAVSVSSFSWLAAFLSTAETIHVPLAGLLDPRERPDADLLPLSDPRYRFHDVSARAWKNRYSDVLAHRADFKPMSVIDAKRLKGAAVRRTAVQSARIHLGLMRRMIFS